MKLENVITAVKTGSFDKVCKMDFGSIATNFKLGNLKRKIMPVLDNYNDQRLLLLEKYGKAIEDTPGSYNFKSLDDGNKFNDEIAKLEEIEVEIEPVEITVVDGLGITGDDFYNLDGIINFKIEEPKKKQKAK